MQIFLDYPWWIFFLGGILLVAVSFLFYRNDKKLQEFSTKTKLLLAILRSSLMVLLFFLLLKPFLKTIISETEKPLLAIAIDNSRSMMLTNDSIALKSINQVIKGFETSFSENYKVDFYNFGDDVKNDNQLDFSDKTTDASQLSTTLKTNYTNRNLAGIVLISDGIFNRGKGADRAFNNLNTPVYSIAVGDSSVQKDLYINNLRSNKIAYLGNDFPVELSIGANFLAENNYQLTISKKGVSVYSENLKIDAKNYFTKKVIFLPAKEKGLQEYKVTLQSLPNEKTLINNTQSFFIDVLDAQQKVLVLAFAPHPDVAAFRMALSKNLNNKVDVFLTSNPKIPQNFSEYNLVVLFQLPDFNNNNTWLKTITESNLPLLIFSGVNTNYAQLSQMGKGVNIVSKKGANQEVFAYLNSDFSSFSLTDDFIALIPNFPPLQSPFGEYKFGNNAKTLFQQKIGPVKTGQPLLAFTEISGNKTGFFLGEGIWRWKLETYKKTYSHKVFDEFIQKLVQFVATKEDKSRFRLNVKNRFYENENVLINAELYDQTYELVTSTEINFEISDSTGKKFAFNMLAGTDVYTLNAGSFSPGVYQYTATTNLSGVAFSKSGSFTIMPLELEKNITRANYNAMKNIAQNTGGEFFGINNIEELIKSINESPKAKPTIYTQEKFFDLINLKWLFFVLLALLSIEWFIRKYKGAY
jgi:hypothetical protein